MNWRRLAESEAPSAPASRFLRLRPLSPPAYRGIRLAGGERVGATESPAKEATLREFVSAIRARLRQF